MTRDYAKKKRNNTGRNTRSNARSSGNGNQRSGYQSPVPGWVWLFTGSVLGAFVMFLVYLTGIPAQPSEFPSLSLSEEKPASEPIQPIEQTPEQSPEQAQPKPRFDFYQLLKESEVTQLEGPTEKPLSTRQTTQYTLQVGSFRNPTDADRLRAELLLMNLEARVEQVTVRNAETWNRVLVGPYNTQSQLAKARGTLAANNFDSLVFKETTKPQEDG